MSLQTTQVQLKISLSEQLSDHLEAKASRLGVPVTQFVKHLILKEVETEDYPVFQASERVEDNAQRALKEYDQAVEADTFFRTLDEG